MRITLSSSDSLVMERESTHEIVIEMSSFELDTGNLETPMTRSFHVIATSREVSPESTESTSESASEHPQCRICLEQEMELQTDPLLRLGCKCIDELGHAHKSCIEEWFGRQLNLGRVTCEICNSGLRMSVLSIAAASTIQLKIQESASTLDSVNLNDTAENIVRVQSGRLPGFNLGGFYPPGPRSEENTNDSDESGRRRILWCFQVLTGVLIVAVLYNFCKIIGG